MIKKLSVTICLIISLLIGTSGLNWSADFNKGLVAARSGDYATALREWTSLAEQGDATAQINLGVMYEDGIGIPKDLKIAVKWYKIAAEQGDARAQVNLGLMYAQGFGVIPDKLYAYMWFNLASSTGDEDATINKDIIAKQMTASELSSAQKLTLECFRKNYKGC